MSRSRHHGVPRVSCKISWLPNGHGSLYHFQPRTESTGADWKHTMADHQETPSTRGSSFPSRLLLDGYTLKSFPGPTSARGTSDLSARCTRFGLFGFWALRVSCLRVARVLPSLTAPSLEPVSIRLNSRSTRGIQVVHDSFISASPLGCGSSPSRSYYGFVSHSRSSSFLQRQISLLSDSELHDHRMCIRDIIHHS